MRSLWAILPFVFLSCSENPVTPTVVLDAPFSLQLHQTAVISPDGIMIRFERVAAEGRCPTDVMCFWEGEAIIDLSVTSPGIRSDIVPLPIYGYVTRLDTLRHRPVDTLGYRFTLMQLDPYPTQDGFHVGAMDIALVNVSRLVR